MPPEEKKANSTEASDSDLMTSALNEINMMHGNALYESTAKSLDELLKSILNRDLSNEGCYFIFKHLEPWITSVNDHERFRSTRCLASVLKYFAENFKIIIDEVY